MLGVDLLERGVQCVLPHTVGTLVAMLYHDPIFERSDTMTEPGVTYRADTAHVVSIGEENCSGKRGGALRSTPRFLYLGYMSMGEGDTNWWMYVVLSGTVCCPLEVSSRTRARSARLVLAQLWCSVYTTTAEPILMGSTSPLSGQTTPRRSLPLLVLLRIRSMSGFGCA